MPKTAAAASAKKALIIVESPSKAKTIQKYLGRAYTVKASVGHIKDLPKSKLGVDVEKNFKPEYQVIKGKDKVIEEIKKVAETVPEIYLAPDPDREGEAIAWHIAQELPKKGKKVHRVLFNAVTKNAILEAMQHPQSLDENKFHSQQARRILDRLVGYKISPILWDKVKRGISAGRVQSVAVRLVVERDAEIKKFKPEEYWTLDAVFEKSGKPFVAKLAKVDGKDPELPNQQVTDALVASVKGVPFTVSSVETRERTRKPQAPFITSRLQQEASSKLGFSAKKTMTLAQHLYEGVDLDEMGTHGLITYMRTDSTRIAPEGIAEARAFIEKEYGKTSLPAEPVVYKTKKSAQDAHEAIRPASLEFAPDKVEKFLERDEFRLYQLIWNRFVACQMVPAVYDQTTMELLAKSKDNHDVLLRVTGSKLKFAGFTAVYEETVDEDQPKKELDDSGEAAVASDAMSQELPDLHEGEKHVAKEFQPAQHFTQPPPRYSDASLIRDLEEKGIGRPSTYAAILSNIQDREYVEKRENRYYPTELGIVVTDLLIQAFPDVLNPAFTAEMEDKLDQIEEGKADWVKMMREFWKPFEKTLENAKLHMKDLKSQEIPTKFRCEKDGAIMVMKWGRMGQFLACSNYPDCKQTAECKKDEKGELVLLPREKSNEKCDKCGAGMLIKHGKFGKFLACERYPDCKGTKAITLGIKCPGCKVGEMTARMSRYKRMFYGCNTYPKCSYALWDKPIDKPCPQCAWPILTDKFTKRDGHIEKCPNKECGYKVVIETPAQLAGAEKTETAA